MQKLYNSRQTRVNMKAIFSTPNKLKRHIKAWQCIGKLNKSKLKQRVLLNLIKLLISFTYNSLLNKLQSTKLPLLSNYLSKEVLSEQTTKT